MAGKMENLAFITQNLSKGGTERVVSNLSLNLTSFNKTLILFDSAIDYPFDAELISLDTFASKNPLIKLVNFFIRLYKIKKIKKGKNINISISFLDNANVINILSKKKDKVIISVRNDKSSSDSSKGFYGNIYNFLTKRLYNKADCIVAVSNGSKNTLISNYAIRPEKIKVIHNPVDIEKASIFSNEELGNFYDNVFNSYTLINIGRLTKAKGQWHLLRIFQGVKKQIPDVKLIIIGDGDLRDYLINLSQRLGLRTYSIWGNQDLSEKYDVYFLGFQSNPFKFLACSTIFVFPSLWEGFPNALVEAMACGVPVVSSDCRSGPREILADDTDFLHETKEPEFAKYGIMMPVLDSRSDINDEVMDDNIRMWVDMIIRMLQDERLRRQYIERGKSRSNSFNVNKIITDWNKTIKGILNDISS